MEKKYVKMNNNQKEFSLGNFCRMVKETALNKTFANQSEVFYAVFGVDKVSDSTINNYCIGYRSIGSEFKQIYIKRSNYPNREFDDTMIGLISILKGKIYNDKSHLEIEKLCKEEIVKKLCLELYNLAKNDESVNNEFTKKIYKLIKEEKIYDCLCEILIYIVLEKKQPIYIEKSTRELFENILNNTNISMNELEQIIKIQLRDGINYTYSLKQLAKQGNSYACFELGNMEYTGMMTGKPRYIKAYEYFKEASLKNHPRAAWLIARMLLHGNIGNKTDDDYDMAYEYLKKAEELGSVAATNTIGIMYLQGLGKEKNLDKAIKCFEISASKNYVYAHNNLGVIYEKQGDLKKAYEHYLFSANLEESWACNKLGQWYRQGIYVKKDLKKAYEYFNASLNVPINLQNKWAYFNLAKYFYLDGNYEAHIEKNINKAIEYFDKIKDYILESYVELIYIYIDKYIKEEKKEYLDKINEYISKLSLKENYKKYEKNIEEKLKCIKNQKIIITNKM